MKSLKKSNNLCVGSQYIKNAYQNDNKHMGGGPGSYRQGLQGNGIIVSRKFVQFLHFVSLRKMQLYSQNFASICFAKKCENFGKNHEMGNFRENNFVNFFCEISLHILIFAKFCEKVLKCQRKHTAFFAKHFVHCKPQLQSEPYYIKCTVQ